jgi:nucleoside-diphosphate-sugar epimerase
MGRPVRVLDTLRGSPHSRAADVQRLEERVRKFGRAVEVVRGDVRDAAVVRKALEGVGRVWHLGHVVGARASQLHPTETLETNVLGTQVLLGQMDESGVDRLVLVSHGQVHGDASGRGFRESDPFFAHTPFAASMVAAEALVTAWHQSSNRERTVSIVRPYTVYGPRMRPTSAVRVFMQALLDRREVHVFGQSTARDYVFASDVVRVLLEARRVSTPDRPAIFNVATGVPTDTNELLRAIEVLVHARANVGVRPRPLGDLQAFWGDPTHTEDVLGLRCRTSLEEGLKLTARWLHLSMRDRPTT